MVIKMGTGIPLESKQVERDSTIEEREAQVYKGYVERIELLMNVFIDTNEKTTWYSKQECKKSFDEFFSEAAFQMDDLTKSLFHPSLNSKIEAKSFETIKQEIWKILEISIVEKDGLFSIDKNKLERVVINIYREYVGEDRKGKNSPGFNISQNPQESLDGIIGTQLTALKRDFKEKLKHLGGNKMFLDRLKKWKGVGLGLPVLGGAFMSTMMTGSLIKFGLVQLELSGAHNLPEYLQTGIAYSLGAAAGIFVANEWVKNGKLAEEINYLESNNLSSKQDKSRLAKRMIATGALSLALIGADYAGIMIRGSQGYDVKNQIDTISGKVAKALVFDPSKVDESSPNKLEKVYSGYVVTARGVKSGILGNIQAEKKSGDGPATRAHGYPIDGASKTLQEVQSVPGDDGLKSSLSQNLKTFDANTRSNLPGQFGQKSGLITGMQESVYDMAENIASTSGETKLTREAYLKTITDYEQSSGLSRLVKEIVTGSTIDMDVRDVKKFQEELVLKITELQTKLQQINSDTKQAVTAYNNYTKSVNDISSEKYNRPPLPLVDLQTKDIDLSEIVNLAKEVPPARATSFGEYMQNMDEIVGDKDIANSIRHGALVRLGINLLLLAYPVIMTLGIPAFRRYLDKKRGLSNKKDQKGFSYQEAQFDNLMKTNVETLMQAMEPIYHIFPGQRELSYQEVEAILVDFLREEYPKAKVLPEQGDGFFEKSIIRGKRFVNDFFFHDGRIDREVEARGLNEALIALRLNPKTDKKEISKISKMSTSSPNIRKQKFSDPRLDKLWKKLFPGLSEEGTGLYELLSDLEEKSNNFKAIVDERNHERDLRDRDIYISIVENIQDVMEKHMDNINNIKTTATTLGIDISNLENQAKDIISELARIIEQEDYKGSVINPISDKYNTFEIDFEDFQKSDAYKAILSESI